MPRRGYAFEVVVPAVGELEPGAGDEVCHGARDKHLTGLREGSDPGSGVHGNAAEVVAALFAFPNMDAGAYLDAEAPGRFGRGERALDGPRWTIERDEEPAACFGHFPAPETPELVAHDLVVAVEHVTPTRVFISNSLYAAWDDIFYPDGVGAWLAKLDADVDGGGLSTDPRFFPHGDDFRGMRVHQTRLQGGDASGDSYCFTS